MDDFDYDASSSTSDDDYFDYNDELPTWATLLIIFGTMAVCFLLFLLAVGLCKIFCDGDRGGGGGGSSGGGGVSYTVESGGGGGGGGHYHHHHHIVRDVIVIEHHHHHHY